MGLRFTLQNEDRVLLDLPLSEREWKPRVKELVMKDCNNSASFTDLLKVAVNPKYISDLVSRSSRQELIVKGDKGYSLSPLGLSSFLLLSLATRRLLRETNSINDDDKSFEGQ